jgi:hypothetical protein
VSASKIDRVVLVQLVSLELDQAEAGLLVETWLDDHPEAGDLVRVVLVPEARLPDGREELLAAIAGLLPTGSSARAEESVAIALGVPAPRADQYGALLGEEDAAWVHLVAGALPSTPGELLTTLAESVHELVGRGCAGGLERAPYDEAALSVVTSPAPVAVEADETVERPAPADVPLLYVVWLGATQDARRRTARRRWVARLLDRVAEHSAGPEEPAQPHRVRLLGLGDGVSGQSPLAPAREFTSPGRWRRRRHQWPQVRGVVNVAHVREELEAQLRRDREQLVYEGYAVGVCSCVVLVGDTFVGQGRQREELRHLAGVDQLHWVVAPRTAAGAAAGDLTTETMLEHPEVDLELVRRLGLQPRPLPLEASAPVGHPAQG